MGDISELSHLSNELNSKLANSIEQLLQDRMRLQEERAEFEAEKELMRCLTAQPSDIIKINVRGTLFETRRSTLCQANRLPKKACLTQCLQVDGCLLQYMFSGRWEDRLERDSEGRVFLDYNPYCFGKILDFLWAMQVGIGSEI